MKTKLINELQNMDENLNNDFRVNLATLSQILMSIINKHQEIIQALQVLQQRVFNDELIHWKRTQKLFSFGVAFENNLDQIQEWFEALAEVI
jgi:hypothetical protein